MIRLKLTCPTPGIPPDPKRKILSILWKYPAKFSVSTTSKCGEWQSKFQDGDPGCRWWITGSFQGCPSVLSVKNAFPSPPSLCFLYFVSHSVRYSSKFLGFLWLDIQRAVEKKCILDLGGEKIINRLLETTGENLELRRKRLVQES